MKNLISNLKFIKPKSYLEKSDKIGQYVSLVQYHSGPKDVNISIFGPKHCKMFICVGNFTIHVLTLVLVLDQNDNEPK
jgi:hypothetical protein